MNIPNKEKIEKYIKDLFSMIFGHENIKEVEVSDYSNENDNLEIKIVFDNFAIRDHALQYIRSLVLLSGLGLRHNKILNSRRIYLRLLSNDEE